MTLPPLNLACAPDNDLYRVLIANDVPCRRFDTAIDAVLAAPPGSGALLLADGYPETPLAIDSRVLETAAGRALRLYLEYPASLPGFQTAPPRAVGLERAVTATDVFAPAIPAGRILMVHGCHYVPVTASPAHLVLARVAGFDTAVYGLPAETFPLLFAPSPSLLVATTKLSQPVTARYAPAECWRVIWEWILARVSPGAASAVRLHWTSTVRPTYGPEEPLPAGAEPDALRRGIAWFRTARMFVNAGWREEAARRIHDFPDGTGDGPARAWPAGDGRDGVLEGVSSSVHPDGTQSVRYFLRNDCAGEVAMAMALHGAVARRAEDGHVAANLGDFVFFTSNLAESHRTDPEHPLHGLLRFSTDEIYGHAYYGDDAARCVLGIMTVAGLHGEERWNASLARTLLGNLRTTGPQGFRSNRLEEADLLRLGWRHFRRLSRTNFRPHYESWLWAAFLRAGASTGFRPFLDSARAAIARTMAAYPDDWHWANGIQQERARMLLPLAWLVRLDDTAEHRQWLRDMADELLARQAPCGAIREEMGLPEMGSYNPPVSNEAYGNDEAPLIQVNSDPLCDQLYTMNFALAGLREAALATGDRHYARAEERLLHFLCRIQVRAESHPELDGAWFRAFDFRDWEYWASNSDQSWGAWCVETGWTQAWITAVLALRQLRTSLWDLTGAVDLQPHLAALAPALLPDETPPP